MIAHIQLVSKFIFLNKTTTQVVKKFKHDYCNRRIMDVFDTWHVYLVGAGVKK